jgi:heme exporter protein A
MVVAAGFYTPARQRPRVRRTVLLQAAGLAAFRGERLVFRDLDLAVAAGGALLLTGPNGSGKSTLLRLLAGLLRPAAGRLTWDGEDALSDLPAHAGRVAYVGHQDAVKPGLTAAENLQFAAQLSGADVGEALAAVGLEDLADLPARMLSAGQKRRLALARLVLSRAPLWLLDEPTLGLDTASVERLGGMLGTHRARGGLVVVGMIITYAITYAIAMAGFDPAIHAPTEVWGWPRQAGPQRLRHG